VDAAVHERVSWLIERRRYELAAELLVQALHVDASDPYGVGLLAFCRLRQEKLEIAEELARRSVQLAPAVAWGYQMLAEVYVSSRKSERALAMASKAVELDPQDARGFVLQARAYWLDDHWKPMLAATEAALALDPGHQFARNLRGFALRGLGQVDLSEKELQNALSVNPEDALSHANLGWTLLLVNKPREALPHFQQALQLNPDLDWAKPGAEQALRWTLPWVLPFSRHQTWQREWTFGALWMVLALLAAYCALQWNQQDESARVWAAVGAFVALQATLMLLATPLADGALLLHPLGRKLLARPHARKGAAISLLVLAAAICGLLGLTVHAWFLSLALWWLALAFPLYLSGEFPRHFAWVMYAEIAVLIVAGIPLLCPLPAGRMAADHVQMAYYAFTHGGRVVPLLLGANALLTGFTIFGPRPL